MYIYLHKNIYRMRKMTSFVCLGLLLKASKHLNSLKINIRKIKAFELIEFVWNNEKMISYESNIAMYEAVKLAIISQ